MLVLSRSVDQGFTLRLPEGGEIQVMLVSSGVGRAKIGIDAPLNVEILRNEKLLQIPEGAIREKLSRGKSAPGKSALAKSA